MTLAPCSWETASVSCCSEYKCFTLPEVGLAVSTTGKMEYWVNGELKHVSEKQPRPASLRGVFC